uniref:CDGSH iron sulfur domain 3 n=1 Tax=Calidris pygmaea TaxID=425635 RepID=A0A8C3J975_9CHAR
MRAAAARPAAGMGGVRRCRDPPGILRIPSLSSAPRVRRRCSAPPQPVVAAKEPFPVELKAGKKYAWCACGHSRSQVGDRGPGRGVGGLRPPQPGCGRDQGRPHGDP